MSQSELAIGLSVYQSHSIGVGVRQSELADGRQTIEVSQLEGSLSRIDSQESGIGVRQSELDIQLGQYKLVSEWETVIVRTQHLSDGKGRARSVT